MKVKTALYGLLLHLSCWPVAIRKATAVFFLSQYVLNHSDSFKNSDKVGNKKQQEKFTPVTAHTWTDALAFLPTMLKHKSWSCACFVCVTVIADCWLFLRRVHVPRQESKFRQSHCLTAVWGCLKVSECQKATFLSIVYIQIIVTSGHSMTVSKEMYACNGAFLIDSIFPFQCWQIFNISYIFRFLSAINPAQLMCETENERYKDDWNYRIKCDSFEMTTYLPRLLCLHLCFWTVGLHSITSLAMGYKFLLILTLCWTKLSASPLQTDWSSESSDNQTVTPDIQVNSPPWDW